jgi:hypothetical protein
VKWTSTIHPSSGCYLPAINESIMGINELVNWLDPNKHGRFNREHTIAGQAWHFSWNLGLNCRNWAHSWRSLNSHPQWPFAPLTSLIPSVSVVNGMKWRLCTIWEDIFRNTQISYIKIYQVGSLYCFTKYPIWNMPMQCLVPFDNHSN